jgi:DtxR family Mn-dependent transcriptional regulator
VRKLIEEAAEHLYDLSERGAPVTADALTEVFPKGDPAPALRRMEAKGLLEMRADGTLALTPEGRDLGRTILRRNRLAETLLQTVLDVKGRDMELTACEFEHVLTPTVEESVCTFLGHPPVCPHGKPIPPGTCCSSFSVDVAPVVMRLEKLPLGERGLVTYITPGERPRLHRLAGLGLVPGATLRLLQRRPSLVVEIGETTLALDERVAAAIFVRREAS